MTALHPSKLTFAVAAILALVAFRPLAPAQQVSYKLLAPEVVAPVSPVTAAQPLTLSEPPEHAKFWDRENSFLFAATAALNTADFFATRNNLRSGGHELNPLTRPFTSSTPLLALNFAGETAGSIGLSYFFHKSGHHKLERLASIVSISSSGAAVTFDLTHR
jgi:hypothetical protein